MHQIIDMKLQTVRHICTMKKEHVSWCAEAMGRHFDIYTYVQQPQRRHKSVFINHFFPCRFCEYSILIYSGCCLS